MASPSDPPRPPSIRSLRSAIPIALLSLGAFIALAVYWMSHPSAPEFDATARQIASRWATQTPAAVMAGISYLGSVPTAIGGALLIALFWWRRGVKRSAITWVVTFAAGEGILFVLKQAFSRTRPSAPGILAREFSFPSGHAFNSVLVYGMLFFLGWQYAERSTARWGLAAATLGIVLGVGWSRLALDVHYATDVLGGYALGAFWLSGTWILLAYQWRSDVSSATRSHR